MEDWTKAPFLITSFVKILALLLGFLWRNLFRIPGRTLEVPLGDIGAPGY